MTRRMARIQVSGALILDALAMPEDTKIYNIVRHDYSPDVFVFYIEHPDLPVLQEASMPVEISPIFTADYDKKPSTWLTFDWNVDTKESKDDRL